MKKLKEKNRFGRIHIEMIKAVVAFALNLVNVAITNSNASFAAIINMLKANLTAIANLEVIAASSVNGYAAQKLALKNTLAEFSAAILQSVTAFAVSTNDTVLLAKVQTTRSTLLGKSYNDLIDYIAAAIDAVEPIVTELADYNITPATITLWKANLAQLNDAYSNPKTKHAQQNSAKKDIQILLRSCMELLYNQADQIAVSFKAANLSYYQEYIYNRKLIPLTRHTKFRVTITNDLGQPVPKAAITQDGTDNSTETNIAGDGSLRVKVEEGKDPLYNFTISKGTQSIQTGLIQIKRGETVSRKYIMEPTGFIIPAHTPETTEKVSVEK